MSEPVKSYSDQLNETETQTGVVMEQSDETGFLHAYSYNAVDQKIGFDFWSMNPELEDVKKIAQAIKTLMDACERNLGTLILESK